MDWSSVEGILLDLCGVLYVSDDAIEGSIEAVKLLRETGLRIRFVTNESQITRKMLVGKLNAMGFDIKEEEVFTPPIAAAKLLTSEGLRPMCLVNKDVMEDLSSLDTTNPNAVLLGDAGELFDYKSLNLTFQLLIGSEKPRLFSMGKGRYYKEGDKLVMDVGPFLKALEYAAGTEGQIVGKPAREFFLTALDDMKLSPEKAVMVGDDIENDVGGAQACGLKGIQVRTGKFRPSDENHPSVKPNLYADNLLVVAQEITRALKR